MLVRQATIATDVEGDRKENLYIDETQLRSLPTVYTPHTVLHRIKLCFAFSLPSAFPVNDASRLNATRDTTLSMSMGGGIGIGAMDDSDGDQQEVIEVQILPQVSQIFTLLNLFQISFDLLLP